MYRSEWSMQHVVYLLLLLLLLLVSFSLLQVITAIKSSLDKHPPQLVLIIKPRDLSRVDPTANDPTPQFSSDPHTLLRESMVSLKEVSSWSAPVCEILILFLSFCSLSLCTFSSLFLHSSPLAFFFHFLRA